MDRSTYDSLTPRELECLRLARDWPTKEIARRTALTPNMVHGHIIIAPDARVGMRDRGYL